MPPLCYPVFVESLGGEFEDEDKEPNAIELFKVCHFSKKRKGYTPTVQLVIAEMENQLTALPIEGQDHKSVAQVVADVLGENRKKTKFLKNVGIVTATPRSNVEALQVEKIVNAELQSIVNSQQTEMEDLSKKLHEAEQARMRLAEETKKKYDELEAKHELVLRSKSTT